MRPVQLVVFVLMEVTVGPASVAMNVALDSSIQIKILKETVPLVTTAKREPVTQCQLLVPQESTYQPLEQFNYPTAKPASLDTSARPQFRPSVFLVAIVLSLRPKLISKL